MNPKSDLKEVKEMGKTATQGRLTKSKASPLKRLIRPNSGNSNQENTKEDENRIKNLKKEMFL